jgi:hypothetical protein
LAYEHAKSGLARGLLYRQDLGTAKSLTII